MYLITLFKNLFFISVWGVLCGCPFISLSPCFSVTPSPAASPGLSIAQVLSEPGQSHPVGWGRGWGWTPRGLRTPAAASGWRRSRSVPPPAPPSAFWPDGLNHCMVYFWLSKWCHPNLTTFCTIQMQTLFWQPWLLFLSICPADTRCFPRPRRADSIEMN